MTHEPEPNPMRAIRKDTGRAAGWSAVRGRRSAYAGLCRLQRAVERYGGYPHSGYGMGQPGSGAARIPMGCPAATARIRRSDTRLKTRELAADLVCCVVWGSATMGRGGRIYFAFACCR